MSSPSRSALLWATLALLVAALPLKAAEFTVNSTADLPDASPGDGLCRSAAATCTLRAAVQETNALAGPDRINLPAGVYALNLAGAGEDFSATGDLDVSDDLDLFGAGPGASIVDAGSLDRVFDVLPNVSASFDGVTLRNGSAVLAGSPGFLGGGVLGRSFSNIDLTDCEILDSVANAGAGLHVGGQAVATVTACAVRGNRTLALGFTNPRGSAVFNQGETDFDQSEASDNRSAAPFGALYSDVASGTLAVRNSTVSGNEDVGVGSVDTELDVESSTIVANSSHGLRFTTGGTDPLSVRNSILADSGGSDCLLVVNPGFLDFAGEHNLDSDGTCPLDGGVNDFPNADPQLAALLPNGGASRSRVPRRGSPVIDSGNDPRCDAIDQRGADRPLDGDNNGSSICDIGAIEVLPCTGTPDAVLASTTVSTITEVVGCFTVTAGPDVQVIAGGDLTLVARDLVALTNGFSVQGGALAVERDPAAGSGMTLP